MSLCDNTVCFLSSIHDFWLNFSSCSFCPPFDKFKEPPLYCPSYILTCTDQFIELHELMWWHVYAASHPCMLSIELLTSFIKREVTKKRPQCICMNILLYNIRPITTCSYILHIWSVYVLHAVGVIIYAFLMNIFNLLLSFDF